jgi:hypothetical protein
MKLKSIKSAYVTHPFDAEKNWTRAGIWQPPAEVDVAAYQQQINDIVGLSPSGAPIVQLKWAWECKKWRNTSWDEFGNATSGEWRQRYVALTVEIGHDDYCDISPPRWILEERFEPAQYANSWEHSRYVHDPAECHRCANVALGLIEQSTSCVRRDLHGPAPRAGWYNLLPHIGIIAKHEHGMQCCDRRWAESREICYGRYKVPGEKELQRLKRAIYLRGQDAETNPQAELDPVALKQARRWGMEIVNEQKVGRREDLKEALRDEVNTHGASIVPDEVLVGLKETGRRYPIHKTIFS